MSKESITINHYNSTFTKELEECVLNLMPILIEAFVRVYGERYRDYIIYTLNSLNYIIFISKRLFLEALLLPNIRKNEKEKIKLYLKYIKEKETLYPNIPSKRKIDFIYESYVTKFPYEKDYISYFISALAAECPTFVDLVIPNNNNAKESKNIILPLYVTCLKDLIHEFNHSITFNLAGINGESLVAPTLFPDEECDELINDYIADLVLKEFLKLGGIIPQPLNRIIIPNKYETRYYLIEKLFNRLGILIIECSISKRYNLFYKSVGYENVVRTSKLIKDLFEHQNNRKWHELNTLIEQMYHNALATKPIDYESLYQELESIGYRVRKLQGD